MDLCLRAKQLGQDFAIRIAVCKNRRAVRFLHLRTAATSEPEVPLDGVLRHLNLSSTVRVLATIPLPFFQYHGRSSEVPVQMLPAATDPQPLLAGCSVSRTRLDPSETGEGPHRHPQLEGKKGKISNSNLGTKR